MVAGRACASRPITLRVIGAPRCALRTQNGRRCCHQRPLCRAMSFGRRLRSQPRRLELRRLASAQPRHFRIGLIFALPGVLAAAAGPSAPILLPRFRFAPSAWPDDWACWPCVWCPAPRQCHPAFATGRHWLRAGLPAAGSAALARSCPSGRGCSLSSAACPCLAFQPLAEARLRRVCQPGLHQPGLSRRPRLSSLPLRDFNSHQRCGLSIVIGSNRFIPLAFPPPSIPGYRWMVSPTPESSK